jgi:HK97 gp10 family phage protein
MAVTGADQLSRLPEEIQKDIIKVMGQVAIAVPNSLRPVTPIRTGHLRQSWKSRHFKYQVKIRNTAFYSDFVENGTSRMQARPMISPLIPVIESEIERAITTGTDFYIRGGAFTDRATQLKNAYQQKYGNYGSQQGFSG